MMPKRHQATTAIEDVESSRFVTPVNLRRGNSGDAESCDWLTILWGRKSAEGNKGARRLAVRLSRCLEEGVPEALHQLEVLFRLLLPVPRASLEVEVIQRGPMFERRRNESIRIHRPRPGFSHFEAQKPRRSASDPGSCRWTCKSAGGAPRLRMRYPETCRTSCIQDTTPRGSRRSSDSFWRTEIYGARWKCRWFGWSSRTGERTFLFVSQQKDLTGIEMALAAAILFGLSTPLAKGLLRDSSPQLMAGLLYSGSGIGLALLAASPLRREHRTEAKLTSRDAPWLAGSILFGGIVAPVLLMTGLARTPASTASLLLNLEGALTAMIAWTVFRENVDRRVALGMALIIIGGGVLSWEGRLQWSGMIGPLAVAGACGCWAIDNNLTQKISAADPVRIAMLKGIVAGLVNVSLAIFLGARLPGMPVLTLTALLGFASYGVSLVLFVLALRRLGTARTSAYFSAGPFVGAIVGLLLWHEALTPSLIAAALLMAAGLYLHVTERHEHWHVHEPLEHSHSHSHDEHHRHPHSESDPPGEPHVHQHVHEALSHSHTHYPDIHHRHGHE